MRGTAAKLVVISGCSGGGKSSLLAELQARGYATVEEPGRRVIRDALPGDDSALPWNRMESFLRRAFDLALADRAAAEHLHGYVFFDRGLIDAAAGLERVTGNSVLAKLDPAQRYHERVFLTPPWPEIYVLDEERRHGLDTAVVEYQHLLTVYPSLGYEVTLLPKVSVKARADFVLQSLAETQPLTDRR
jgi:predicted ATPase